MDVDCLNNEILRTITPIEVINDINDESSELSNSNDVSVATPIEISNDVNEESRSVTDSLECSICLESLNGDESSIITTPCDHTFHADCLNEWVGHKPSCPICRSVLSSGDSAPSTVDNNYISSGSDHNYISWESIINRTDSYDDYRRIINQRYENYRQRIRPNREIRDKRLVNIIYALIVIGLLTLTIIYLFPQATGSVIFILSIVLLIVLFPELRITIII
jgi:hypothetical protein